MKIYEVKHFPRLSKDLLSMRNSNKISFNNAAQRGDVWVNTQSNNQKSLFIDSLIRGFPRVDAMDWNCVFTDPKNKHYDALDGKQRVTTVCDFMEDKFPLIGLELFNLDEEAEDDEDSKKLFDLNGLRYSQLPEDFQSIINNYSFTIYYYENLTQEEADELIRRKNNGKSFTAIELTRLYAKSLDVIKSISQHQIFTEALTFKAINKYTDEDIIIKSWAILNVENPSFETKNIRALIKTADITDDQKQILESCFTRILDSYRNIKSMESKENDEKLKKSLSKVAKRLFTRTHLITIMPIVQTSIVDNVSLDSFINWCIHFFSGTRSATISEEYNNNAAAGSASTEAIRKRLTAAMSDYNYFIESSAAQTKLEPQQEI